MFTSWWSRRAKGKPDLDLVAWPATRRSGGDLGNLDILQSSNGFRYALITPEHLILFKNLVDSRNSQNATIPARSPCNQGVVLSSATPWRNATVGFRSVEVAVDWCVDVRISPTIWSFSLPVDDCDCRALIREKRASSSPAVRWDA